jgi:hypothetical protein
LRLPLWNTRPTDDPSFLLAVNATHVVVWHNHNNTPLCFSLLLRDIIDARSAGANFEDSAEIVAHSTDIACRPTPPFPCPMPLIRLSPPPNFSSCYPTLDAKHNPNAKRLLPRSLSLLLTSHQMRPEALLPPLCPRPLPLGAVPCRQTFFLLQLSVNERWPFGNRHLKSQGLRVQLPRNIHPWAAPSTSASRLSPSLPSATTIENSQRGASSLIRGFGLSGKYRASEVLRRCPCHSILSDQHERCLDMIL